MKKKILLMCILSSACLFIAYAYKNKNTLCKSSFKASVTWQDSLKDGDLIFQISTAGQGTAIQLATHSRYTHIAVIFKDNGKWMVYEAVEPVQKIALEAFIKRGDSGKIVIKRLIKRDSLLTDVNLTKMKNYLQNQIHKHYDIYFGWQDDKMYCSELVWKCYKEAGLTISPLKPLKTFDLSNPLVKTIMAKRYGKHIPYEESVISPGDIFNEQTLRTVYQN